MASTCNLITVLLIVSTVTTKGISGSGQAEGCGGMIEADNGTLQLEPSYRSCLWVINLKNATGMRLELNPSMVTPILVIPQQKVSDENLKSFWIKGSKEMFYNYKGKSLTIVAPNRKEKSNLSWTGLAEDISGVSLSTKFVNESNGTFNWKHDHDGRDQIFWAFHHRTGGKISWNLDTLLPACYPLDPCESLYFAVLEIVANGTISEIRKTCEGSSKLSMMLAKGSQVLVLLHINAPVKATTSFQVTWKYEEQLRRNVHGLIAGSLTSGPLIIPFNSTQAHIANSTYVNGVAFDCNSSQIYWLQHSTGIVQANLNGSDTKTLLLDKYSELKGLAIDPVSGNFYFGDHSSGTIRVCNKNANKCSTIANGSDASSVWDLAVHWSKGFLFWSIYNKKIVRTNLDGSNRKDLVYDYGVQGIAVDEEEDRLYWAHTYGIKSCDLDGGETWPLPSVNTATNDVAIHGENVYYAPWNTKRIDVISKLGTNPKPFANLTEKARYLTLYGKRISSLPRNPCEKSNCSHLCVRISPSSSRCLFPDGKKVASDGTTCIALIPQQVFNVL